MYESYSQQALPSKEYRELLGSSLCVFNSNNSFLIENILKYDKNNKVNWYNLIDKTSGRLDPYIKSAIEGDIGVKVCSNFNEIVDKRNRIIHSFQITYEDNEQCLATKDENGNQFKITKDYLLDFIKENEMFSILMYEVRDQLKK